MRVTASHADIMATMDGQVGFGVTSGDSIYIGRRPHPVRLVRFGPRRFYRELRERLGQGSRIRSRGKAKFGHETSTA